MLTVLRNLAEQFKGLLHNILLDHFHNLVLLESLTRQIQRQIFGINHTLNEAKPLRNEISCVISDENTSNIELDVVLGLLGLE
jgi:hypothetical protein